LLHLVSQYGYLAVFFGVMLESAGVPLPGETVLLASGALAHEGILDPGDGTSLSRPSAWDAPRYSSTGTAAEPSSWHASLRV
jgi:hypothetical protein